MSQTLLLMGATLSPILDQLLPPSYQMDAILKDMVEELGRLGSLAPGLQLCAEIVGEAEERRRDNFIV